MNYITPFYTRFSSILITHGVRGTVLTWDVQDSMKISLIGLTLDISGEATFAAPIYLRLTCYLNNAFLKTESFLSIILENLEREYASP